MATLINRNEVVFHRPIIGRLIGNFGRNSAPAKFPKIYDRRVPGEFREPWSRNMLTRGGFWFIRGYRQPDARSILPAGCGNRRGIAGLPPRGPNFIHRGAPAITMGFPSVIEAAASLVVASSI